jgi:hypothetical protein
MDQNLDKLAFHCRQLYCLAMRRFLQISRGRVSSYGDKPIVQWDGGQRPKDGKIFKPVWPKVAAFVQQHGLNAEWLVALVFQANRDKPYPPSPTHLCTPRALQIYNEYAPQANADRVDYLRRRWESQTQELKTQTLLAEAYGSYSASECLHYVLSNIHIPLSALFRVCVADIAGMNDLVDIYLSSAIDQYQADPLSYNKAWSGKIPNQVRLRSGLAPRSLVTLNR